MWEELLMRYVQYMLWCNTLPGGVALQDHFLRQQMVDKRFIITALNKALEELQMDPSQFNTHSFRIGAATSAKQAGISDTHLKALGRWRSDAYQKYVRLYITTGFGWVVQIPGICTTWESAQQWNLHNNGICTTQETNLGVTLKTPIIRN